MLSTIGRNKIKELLSPLMEDVNYKIKDHSQVSYKIMGVLLNLEGRTSNGIMPLQSMMHLLRVCTSIHCKAKLAIIFINISHTRVL